MTRDRSFKDHFSGHAPQYAAHRPSYPAALFEFLARCCDRRDHAWDAGTGNGQAAVALAEYFARVTATDASARQIEAARAHPGVAYRVAPAEASGLAAGSADLVTVAQALHWFDFERFFAEADRVLAPGGVLAAWSYGFCAVDPACDELIAGLYTATAEHWPPERRLVENGYRDIVMPFSAVAAPAFDMKAAWGVDAMLGYLRTWSGCRRYLEARGVDPVAAIERRLRTAWGPGARDVRWPLALEVRRRQAAARESAAGARG